MNRIRFYVEKNGKYIKRVYKTAAGAINCAKKVAETSDKLRDSVSVICSDGTTLWSY